MIPCLDGYLTKPLNPRLWEGLRLPSQIRVFEGWGSFAGVECYSALVSCLLGNECNLEF